MILFERQDLAFRIHTNILFSTVPPRWILEPTDKAFAQGSDAKVECKADGFPKPQVVWKKAVGKLILSYILKPIFTNSLPKATPLENTKT